MFMFGPEIFDININKFFSQHKLFEDSYFSLQICNVMKWIYRPTDRDFQCYISLFRKSKCFRNKLKKKKKNFKPSPKNK